MLKELYYVLVGKYAAGQEEKSAELARKRMLEWGVEEEKMPQFFKTAYFSAHFEDAARANLARELENLS